MYVGIFILIKGATTNGLRLQVRSNSQSLTKKKDFISGYKALRVCWDIILVNGFNKSMGDK